MTLVPRYSVAMTPVRLITALEAETKKKGNDLCRPRSFHRSFDTIFRRNHVPDRVVVFGFFTAVDIEDQLVRPFFSAVGRASHGTR